MVYMSTFKNNKEVSKEKIPTLAEFIHFSRLKVGQKLLLGSIETIENKQQLKVTKQLWIGDATPLSGDFSSANGWDLKSELCQLLVLRVIEFE